jgi:DNA-binding response OmpR family regulator
MNPSPLLAPRILLVDDDTGIRKLVRRVLVRAGYEVAESTDGLNGLRQMRAGHFDLLITDLVMPDMDGLELIRETRASRPEVPILAMSGGGKVPAPVYLRLAEVLGAGKVLAKPFEIPALLQAVSILLGRWTPQVPSTGGVDETADPGGLPERTAGSDVLRVS